MSGTVTVFRPYTNWSVASAGIRCGIECTFVTARRTPLSRSALPLSSARSERRSQRRRRLGRRGACLGEERSHAEEAVDHAVVALELDGDARFAEPRRVGLALVAEGIELRGDDASRGEAAQVLRAERVDVRVSPIDPRSAVEVPEPLHHVAGEEVALGV